MGKYFRRFSLIGLVWMLMFPLTVQGEKREKGQATVLQQQPIQKDQYPYPLAGKVTSHKTIPRKDDYVKDEIIIKFRNDTLQSSISNLSKNLGLRFTKKYKSFGGILVKIPHNKSVEEVLAVLEKSGFVEYAVPNYIRQKTAVSDPYFSQLWGLKNTGQTIQDYPGVSGFDINAETAWTKTKGSHSVVVAVIDSGIDINHPDLKENIWRNPGEGTVADGIDNDGNGYIDDLNGWDFYSNNRTVFDDPFIDEHATHVAGTIAASANDRGVIGIAPNVKIMPLKFMGANSGTDAGAIEAIEYAKAKGVKIFNLSWGGYGNSPALYDAIKNTNGLFIVAAGNDGNNNDGAYRTVPASFDLPNIISVAAMDNSGYLTDFSNYGIKTIDVAAPGLAILSTVPRNRYAHFDGTSMAAPHVAGTAALVLSANPKYSVSQIKNTILKSGIPVPGLDKWVGTGRMISAGRAVHYTADDELPGVPLSGSQITGALNNVNDMDDVYSVKLQKGERISLSLTGATGTDFDLFLFDRSAKTVLYENGKVLARSQKSGTSSESIVFRAPSAGTYYIDVYGKKGKGSYTLKNQLGDPSAFYENTSAGIVYSGSWSKVTNSNASGGTYHSVNASGGAMQFVFNGTGIRLTGLKNPTQGYAKISVDGVSTLINLNSSANEFNSTLFEKTGLTPGRHTLRVEWTGKSGSTASKTAKAINVDAITVFGSSTTYTVEDNHSTIKKTGTWSTSKNNSYSGGAASFSSKAGSTMELSFTGNSVKLFASKAANRGLFEVYIDGKLDKTVNTHAPNTQYKSVVYEKAGLTSDAHKIRIVVKGQKAAASTGTAVYLDGFTISAPKQTVVQENRMQLGGSWSTVTNSKHSGGKALSASTSGRTAQLTFTGRSIKLLGYKGTSGGLADVYIDGKLAKTVSSYSDTPVYKAVLFEKNDLTAGNHVIKVVVKGKKVSASKGITVFFDALLVD
ncbi:hypothetical protein D1B31_15865 [Neobacillus notoginsengisoli]|uniref:Peptidase S8 n=1 Tax=Neobacillus notoginsengisoli TaxID=1578198 RepID=A0A417YRK9_9BACI|nr:S8 family serine peptidase [Neobacillus notoginsengisoli]RHW37243.1 hypothetical protein D1B31_15865 [Neobacillus notoginsengisoli]